MTRVVVDVMLSRGWLDPQGRAVMGALGRPRPDRCRLRPARASASRSRSRAEVDEELSERLQRADRRVTVEQPRDRGDEIYEEGDEIASHCDDCVCEPGAQVPADATGAADQGGWPAVVRAAAAGPGRSTSRPRPRSRTPDAHRRRDLPRVAGRPGCRARRADRRRESVALSHADADLHAVDVSCCPVASRSATTWLRAISRFAPAIAAIIDAARVGSRCSASATAFRSSASPPPARRADRANAGLHFVCGDQGSRSPSRPRRGPASTRPGSASSSR